MSWRSKVETIMFTTDNEVLGAPAAMTTAYNNLVAASVRP